MENFSLETFSNFGCFRLVITELDLKTVRKKVRPVKPAHFFLINPQVKDQVKIFFQAVIIASYLYILFGDNFAPTLIKRSSFDKSIREVAVQIGSAFTVVLVNLSERPGHIAQK